MIERQFKYLDNFNMYVNYLMEEGCDNVMARVEEEALKMSDFLMSVADFPFITDRDEQQGVHLRKAIQDLEILTDSYMVAEY